jgi:hypothetical protein
MVQRQTTPDRQRTHTLKRLETAKRNSREAIANQLQLNMATAARQLALIALLVGCATVSAQQCGGERDRGTSNRC